MTILFTILACIYCIIATIFYFISILDNSNMNSFKRLMICIFWIFLFFEIPYILIKDLFSKNKLKK